MIASKYSLALYNVAKKRNIIEEVSHDLKLLNHLLLISDKLKTFLENPILKKNEKLEILKKINFSTDMIKDFVFFLLTKNDLYHIKNIYYIFNKICLKRQNTIKVKIFTTTGITKVVREKLLKVLEKKLKNNIYLEEIIDKKLLGGIKLEFNDKVLDATFRGYLDSIKKISIL